MEYAPVISAVVAGVACIVVLWVNFGRPWLRSIRLRRPFHAHLVAPDGNDTDKLVLPAHTEVTVQIRYVPKLTYKQENLKFGFKGDAAKKPIPLSTFNAFIKTGKFRQESPSDNSNHFIDSKDIYHIREPIERSRGLVYTVGFKVMTREPGEYRVQFTAFTEAGSGLPDKELVVVVEEQTTTLAAHNSNERLATPKGR
jgi:hypothetical protein